MKKYIMATALALVLGTAAFSSAQAVVYKPYAGGSPGPYIPNAALIGTNLDAKVGHMRQDEIDFFAYRYATKHPGFDFNTFDWARYFTSREVAMSYFENRAPAMLARQKLRADFEAGRFSITPEILAATGFIDQPDPQNKFKIDWKKVFKAIVDWLNGPI